MTKTEKDKINKLLTACEILDEAGIGFSDFGGDSSTQECFQNDFLAFLMYLSSSDELISQPEADFMNEYLGLDGVTPQQFADLVNGMGIYSEEFAGTVPNILKLFVNADLQMAAAGAPVVPPLAVQICDVFEEAGVAFLRCDNYVHETEAQNLAQYMKMMRGFVGKSLAQKGTEE